LSPAQRDEFGLPEKGGLLRLFGNFNTFLNLFKGVIMFAATITRIAKAMAVSAGKKLSRSLKKRRQSHEPT